MRQATVLGVIVGKNHSTWRKTTVRIIFQIFISTIRPSVTSNISFDIHPCISITHLSNWIPMRIVNIAMIFACYCHHADKFDGPNFYKFFIILIQNRVHSTQILVLIYNVFFCYSKFSVVKIFFVAGVGIPCECIVGMHCSS